MKHYLEKTVPYAQSWPFLCFTFQGGRLLFGYVLLRIWLFFTFFFSLVLLSRVESSSALVRFLSSWLFRWVRVSCFSSRLSQQTLHTDWRTCGQSWPHGLLCSHATDSWPSESLKIPSLLLFFLLPSEGARVTLWLNKVSRFPPVSVFSLGCGLALHEMPVDFGIFLFFSCEALTVIVEVWLTCGSYVVVLGCIFFLHTLHCRQDCFKCLSVQVKFPVKAMSSEM